MDIIISIALLLPTIVIGLIVAIAIKLEDGGKIIFTQKRVGQYSRLFSIYKFRSMTEKERDYICKDGSEITKVGRFIRKYHIDELPQIINVLIGDMSIVGSRPELPSYVKTYNNKELSLFLLPVGIISNASLHFKNEDQILWGSTDKSLYNKILKEKLLMDLEYISSISFKTDINIIVKTILEIIFLHSNRH